jgi:hypothetical protein
MHVTTDPQRLADALNKRRGDLNLSQPEIARQAEVSLSTVNHMATAKRANYRLVQKSRVEKVLRWQPGSIDALLAGGDATPLPTDAAVVPIRRGEIDDLPPELSAAVAAMSGTTRDLFLRLALRIADELTDSLTGSRIATGSNTPVAVRTETGTSHVVALDDLEVASEQVEASAAALRERLRQVREAQARSNQ